MASSIWTNHPIEGDIGVIETYLEIEHGWWGNEFMYYRYRLHWDPIDELWSYDRPDVEGVDCDSGSRLLIFIFLFLYINNLMSQSKSFAKVADFFNMQGYNSILSANRKATQLLYDSYNYIECRVISASLHIVEEVGGSPEDRGVESKHPLDPIFDVGRVEQHRKLLLSVWDASISY